MRHRYQQPELFQAAPARFLEDGGYRFEQDTSGPNHALVSTATGWRWDRPGGDWIGVDGVRYSPLSWASAPSVGGARTVDGATVHDVRTVALDVTAAVNHCHATARWLALLLTATGAFRSFAGRTHATSAAPVIRVEYEDGTQGVLPCLCASNGGVSTANSPGATSSAVVSCPAFLEFARPAGPVRSASLEIVVVEHWSGANPALHVWVLDPPTAENEPVVQGLAQGYTLDAGITAHPAIIGAHTYRDGEPAPILPGSLDIHHDKEFSQHFWGGPRDESLLPFKGAGQWVNLPPTAKIVPSTHDEPGYAPLAPGLGALRLHMPSANLKRGDIVMSHGTTGATAALYLPEDQMGRLKRIFVRYYFRAAPFKFTAADRLLVQNSPGAWSFTHGSGKFGIAPSHDTEPGGVSMTSGGPDGWQMRAGWLMNHTPGPDHGGLVVGSHLDDFYDRKVPAEHRYGNGEPTWLHRWGRKGLGVLYPGHWYCIETELDLNTILNAPPGWQADGALRTWIDGKLAFDRAGMMFRSGPVNRGMYRQRPMRELGIRNLWLCWFHGGKTQATVAQTHYYAGLAWGTEYIGPMRGIS
jgi:hypothetical protein